MSFSILAQTRFRFTASDYHGLARTFPHKKSPACATLRKPGIGRLCVRGLLLEKYVSLSKFLNDVNKFFRLSGFAYLCR